jgi:hypothetical protein
VAVVHYFTSFGQELYREERFKLAKRRDNYLDASGDYMENKH